MYIEHEFQQRYIKEYNWNSYRSNVRYRSEKGEKDFFLKWEFITFSENRKRAKNIRKRVKRKTRKDQQTTNLKLLPEPETNKKYAETDQNK